VRKDVCSKLKICLQLFQKLSRELRLEKKTGLRVGTLDIPYALLKQQLTDFLATNPSLAYLFLFYKSSPFAFYVSDSSKSQIGKFEALAVGVLENYNKRMPVSEQFLVYGGRN
jgi:hypothetical protein